MDSRTGSKISIGRTGGASPFEIISELRQIKMIDVRKKLLKIMAQCAIMKSMGIVNGTFRSQLMYYFLYHNYDYTGFYRISDILSCG